MGDARNECDDQGRKKVKCLVCGRYYHRLDVHLGAKHNITVEKYKQKFPNVVTISAAAKARARATHRKQQAGKKQKGSTEVVEGVYRIGVATLRRRDDLSVHDIPFVPEHDENFVFGKVEMENWEDIAIGIEDNEPIYVAGPTGCGKTASIKELGAVLNQPVRRVQLNRDYKVSEFVGRGTLETDEHGNTITGWKDGVLTSCMRYGWWLLLDEIDNGHPDVLMKLQAVLEGEPLVLTENFGEVIKPHEHFRIIATANTLGKGDETGLYAGTKVMNEATLDRFGVVLKVNYPDKQTEQNIIVGKTGIDFEIASKMVMVAHEIRGALAKEECCCIFSTRRLISWARKTVCYKGDARRASRSAVLNKLETEDEQFVNHIIQRYFGGDI